MFAHPSTFASLSAVYVPLNSPDKGHPSWTSIDIAPIFSTPVCRLRDRSPANPQAFRETAVAGPPSVSPFLIHPVATDPNQWPRVPRVSRFFRLRKPLAPRKTGQISRRGSSAWLVRVYVGRDPETRKRKYIGKFIHDGLHDAQARLNRMLAERDLGRNIRSSRQTLGQYRLRRR